MYALSAVFMCITAASLAEICSAIPLRCLCRVLCDLCFAQPAVTQRFDLHLGRAERRRSLRSLLWLHVRIFPSIWSLTNRERSVAFWTTTAWTSFVASNSQATANFILSELAAFNIDWPVGDPLDDGNIQFRAVVWACSEVLLLFAVLLNFLPRAF